MSTADEQDEQSQNVAPTEDLDEKTARHTTKKPAKRPVMQIYRPPGLRPGNGDSVATKPSQEAGSKPPKNQDKKITEENNNVRGENRDSNSRASSRASPERDARRLNRTESSLSSESALSQKSASSGGIRSNGKEAPVQEKKPKQTTPPKKEPKKKMMSEKEMIDAGNALRSLNLGTNASELDQWISGNFSSDELAEVVGSALCQHAIEGGGGRGVAKLCGSLKDAASVKGLIKGLLNSISQYLECRDKLRADHFRMWISFLNFVSDLYSNLGGADGEMVSCIFQVFDYLLRPPVLETLKIEELECLISTLLSVGYDLERECPDKLALLKDLIRDAFISVSEPWARKMILLLLELGASGWKLPPEANEYYFQQS